MELQNIKSNTTWQEASATLNNNYDKINLAIMTLENASILFKGYYATYDDLVAAFPSPSKGSIAHVGTAYPFRIYKENFGSWLDTGIDADGENGSIDDFSKAVKSVDFYFNSEDSVTFEENNFNKHRTLILPCAAEGVAGFMSAQQVRDLNTSIKTKEQSLTKEEKQQACNNMGVVMMDTTKTEDNILSMIENGSIDNNTLYIVLE